MDQQAPLLLERGSRWLVARIKDAMLPLLSSLLSGLIAYGFLFTNKLINHDDVHCLFDKGATVSSGRWGLALCQRIFPNYSMPWLYGLLTLALIAAAVCLMVRMFSIRSRLLQVLLAGTVTVFPSLMGTLSYMFTSASFALAFLLAVLAAFLLRHPRPPAVAAALGCMILSLGIYQSYISLCAGLLVLLLIRQLLAEEPVKPILRRGCGYLLFLAVSLAGYYAVTRILQQLAGVGFSGYAGNALALAPTQFPHRLAAAYGNFFRFFRDGFRGLMPTALSRWMHRLLLAAAGALLLTWVLVRKIREPGRLVLLFALAGLLPLAVNCMYLLAAEDAVHTLVLYGFVTVYVLAVLLAENCLPLLPERACPRLLRRAGLEAVTLSMALILAGNVCTANAASLQLYLRYENAFSFYSGLAANIQMQPGFDESTRLAVIGQYHSPDFYSKEFADLENITGTAGFLPDNYSRDQFLEYYLGFSIPFASEEEIQTISISPEFAEMPVYPYYGSMRQFGDVLVVKLS